VTLAAEPKSGFGVDPPRAQLFAGRLRPPFSRRLLPLDRFWWAVGSPTRLVGMFVIIGIIMWLAFISIGWSALLFILGMVLFAHFVPFMWAARLGIRIDEVGVHDFRRFRHLIYRWDDGCQIFANVGRVEHFRGLVVLIGPDNTEPRVLLGSWCRDRAQLRVLIRDIRASGYLVADVADGPDLVAT
jgi:hypothetical protein